MAESLCKTVTFSSRMQMYSAVCRSCMSTSASWAFGTIFFSSLSLLSTMYWKGLLLISDATRLFFPIVNMAFLLISPPRSCSVTNLWCVCVCRRCVRYDTARGYIYR
uniref:Uncharacterized protein n=1 Tax=Arundo donax TaxID=35708 RepID=A0A0A8ZJ46_ARUDO